VTVVLYVHVGSLYPGVGRMVERWSRLASFDVRHLIVTPLITNQCKYTDAEL